MSYYKDMEPPPSMTYRQRVRKNNPLFFEPTYERSDFKSRAPEVIWLIIVAILVVPLLWASVQFANSAIHEPPMGPHGFTTESTVPNPAITEPPPTVSPAEPPPSSSDMGYGSQNQMRTGGANPNNLCTGEGTALVPCPTDPQTPGGAEGTGSSAGP